MTPEPTPVSGITPRLPASVEPLTVIRTTAGLTLAATLIVADDSSIVTGRGAPTLVPCAVTWFVTTRLRAPVALRPSTVPPAASTAESKATATSDPAPEPRRRGGVGFTGWVTGAGSYQRSGVGATGVSQSRAQSARGSGVGAKRSVAVSPSGVPIDGGAGVAGSGAADASE